MRETHRAINQGAFHAPDNYILFTITTELIPNIPNELFKIVLTLPSSRGWLATSPGNSHSGSSRSRLIVGWHKPSSKAGRLPANSKAPAAPIAWPMKLLVLLNAVWMPFSPQTRRRAWHSWASPEVVPVACVLTMSTCSARESRPPQGQVDALGLTLGIGQHEIGGVAVHGVADHLAVDFGAAGPGVAEPLQHEHAAALGHDDAVAVGVEGPGRLGRVFVLGQRPLAMETGENAERVNAFRNAAAQRNVAIAQPEHLDALDDARVAGGTGGAQRVVRPGDAHVQRNLAGRIVGHGSRIVMVRPVLRVVVVTLEQIDLVLGLDVAVFGHADVDADGRAVDVFPVEARIGHGLVGAIDADAAGAGAAANLLAFLIAKLVEVADPGHGWPKIADLVGRHAATAFQQGLAKLGQGIAVRRGKTHAGNHHPLMIRPFHDCCPGVSRCQTT